MDATATTRMAAVMPPSTWARAGWEYRCSISGTDPAALNLFMSERYSSKDMEPKPTMGISVMWSIRSAPSMMLILMSCMGTAPAWCPQQIVDQGKTHILHGASIFDTPPSNMADLVPVTAEDRDTWDLDRIDPYLVCHYSKTARTVTLHMVGAKNCTMMGHPFRGSCT